MNSGKSEHLVYLLPEDEETYEVLERAARSLEPGSKSMVEQNLEKGKNGKAREALILVPEAEEVRKSNPIMS